MKKFFSLVLALVMALSLTTVAWGATEVEWYGGHDADTAAKLTDFLSANDIDDGTTIKLTGAYYDLSLPAGTDVPKDLTIVGLGQNNTPVVSCIITADVDGLTLKNIWFMAGGGITGNASGANDQVIKNMTVDGCFFQGSQAALNLGSGVCENMTITNCQFIDAPSSNAIRLYNVSGTTTITGNEIAQAPSYGVALLGTVEGTVDISADSMANITKGAFRVDQILAGAVVTISGNDKIADSALANGQVMKITSVAAGASVTATGLPSGAKTLVEEGNVTLTDDFSGLAMDADKKITAGTFSSDVSEYVAEGYIIVGNSVEKSSKKTNTYDGLYAKDTNDSSDADPVAVEVVVTPAKAVKYDKTTGELEEWGTVEHVNITGDSTDYVFVNSLKEADVVLYKDAEGKFVKFYLDAIETPDYVEGVAFNDFGEDCGEVDYDEDDGYDKKLKYFTIKGVEEFVLVEEAEEYACDFYVMYNNKLVPVVELGLDKVEHKVVTESEDGDLVKVYCSACGTQAIKAPNYLSVPKGAELVEGTGAEIWYWPVAGVSVPSTDKTVTSAETFDAGIAMYVGMSVMAACGSAVVIGKKKD